MASDRPRLSLCVITKNEESNLPRCLASVDGLVDEIVVNDSRSTDRTVEIAEDAGARVAHFDWCDDFSAAYNNCIDHARGDWILLLDADEELAPNQFGMVRACMARDEAFAFTVLRQDFYGDAATPESQSEMLQLRLFRRHGDVRFRGRIHQQLEPSLSRVAHAQHRRVLPSQLRIKHYGYMGDQPVRKLERSIRLLEMELRDRPGVFYYLVELGRSKIAAGDASGLDDLRAAAAQVVAGEAPATESSPMHQLLFEQLLTLTALPDDFPMSFEQIEAAVRELYPRSVPLLWQLARRLFAAQDFQQAAELLQRIRELARTGSYDKGCSFNPVLIGADVALNLGVSLAHLGEIEDAIACLEEVVSDPVRGAAARANIEALRGLLDQTA